MISLSRAVWRQFRAGFWRFLEFDVFFKILAAVVLQPISAWLASVLISSTGYPAFSNERIIAFLLSPVGVATVIVSGTAAAAIIFTEFAGLVVLNAALSSSRPMTSAEALWRTIKKLPELAKLGMVVIVAFGLALTPFAALAALTYRALLSGADINYFLAETPPRFWAAAAIGLVLLIGAALVVAMLYIRWIFSVPALLFEAKGAVAALRKSSELVAGSMLKVGGVLLAWGGAIFAAGLVVTGLVDLLGPFLVAAVGGDRGVVLVMVGVIGALYVTALVALAFLGVTINGLLIVGLYRDLLSRKGVEEEASAEQLIGREPSSAAQQRFRLANRKAWIVAFLGLVSSAAVAFSLIGDLGAERPVAVTAHRGSSSRAPENTLSAIEAAIEDGADFAEIDVQETADGVIVLLHDADLLRLAGVDWKIWESEYAALAELDIGSWFSPEYQSERIATLDEAIELARGKIKLNVELKYNGHDKTLAGRVVEILERQDFVSQAVVSSLDERGLEEVRGLDDQIQIGFIIFRSVGDISKMDVDFFSIDSRQASTDLIARVKRRGKGVHVWTVNDPRQMSSFIDRGVDNIITDYPEVLREMLTERSELEDADRVLLAFRNWIQR